MQPNPIATAPSFHCARRTNDGEYWLMALSISAFTSLWVVALGMKALDGDKGQVAVGVLGLFLFVPLTFFSWKVLLFPNEYELVIENHTIRWGRTDQRAQQTLMRLSQVKQWVFDRGEQELLAYTGCIALKKIGLGVLNEQRAKEVIRFLEQQYPEIPVVDRSGEKVTV
jgi:hypothetical protein